MKPVDRGADTVWKDGWFWVVAWPYEDGATDIDAQWRRPKRFDELSTADRRFIGQNIDKVSPTLLGEAKRLSDSFEEECQALKQAREARQTARKGARAK